MISRSALKPAAFREEDVKARRALLCFVKDFTENVELQSVNEFVPNNCLFASQVECRIEAFNA